MKSRFASIIARSKHVLMTYGICEFARVFQSRIYRKLAYGSAANRYYTVHEASKFPLCARLATSDAQVLHDIFSNDQYGALSLDYEPRLILDCGANVGYASVYFLNRYKTAHVIAVEPDSGNLEICRRNLAPYKDRCTILPIAVWSHTAALKVVRGAYRDGAEWSIQVKECRDGEEPDVYAKSIADILSGTSFAQIDVLKMDIERAESQIFAGKDLRWLSVVKNIVIELHDEECRQIFFAALSGYNYSCVESGETVVCKNLQLIK
jgi:FkbM family methyltransferase